MLRLKDYKSWKLNELNSTVETIITTKITSEKGLKKLILEEIKSHLDVSLSFDKFREILKSLKNDGVESKLIDIFLDERYIYDLYIKNQKEIDQLILESKWINNNKSKFNDLDIKDIIIRGTSYIIKYLSGILYSEIFD